MDKWVAEIVEKLPLQDLQERSAFRSWRLIFRVFSVAVLGVSIALSTDSLVFRGIGIMLLAISMSWADLIAEECRQIRFFPSLATNKFFGILFRWEIAALIFATLYIFAVCGFQSLKVLDAAVIGQFWAIPFLLMRLNRYACATADELEGKLSTSAPERKGPFLFPQFHEILSMVLDSIDIRTERDDGMSDCRSQLSEGAEIARQTVARCVAQAVEIPVYNLNQLSRSAADALAEALAKVKFVKPASEASTSEDGSQESNELTIPAPNPQKFQRKGVSRNIPSLALRMITLPMRFLSREALLWERRDIPLYACMSIILTFFYFGIGHFSWLVLIAFSGMLGPKSKAAGALRDLQNELGKMYMQNDAKDDEIVRPPLWSVISVPMCFYMTFVHVIGWMGAYAFFMPNSWTEVTGIAAPSAFSNWFAIVLWPVTAFGITGGVHRLWAHRSYHANFPYRVVCMLLNSMANQGSIFHWARDHRVHHLYSDSEADPYNARRGFFFCHMGWLLVQKNQEVRKAGKGLDLNDLYADPVVMFQKRLDPIWNLFWCFGVPTIVSMWMGDGWVNGLLVPGAFRYMFVLHATWCVNSLVHTFGESKPYDPRHPTRESAIVAFLTVGEGWHNWHHAYGWDYAAAELDWHRQFNPTKMVIDLCAKFGWVSGRKRAHTHWNNRRKRWTEHYGRDPVRGLRGIPPFQHREVDYELLAQSPRNLKKGDILPGMEEDQAMPMSPKPSKRRMAQCTKAGAARGVVTGTAALLVAGGAVVQGFANSYLIIFPLKYDN